MLMKEAILYQGFALLDILQPCVTFNRINTHEWYKKRVYHIEPEYNPEDRTEAFKRALEWGDRIPVGIIYKNSRPALEERIPVLRDNPLVKQPIDLSSLETTLKEFY
jgi:2-oxoglutarate ferredoxin oxidoreductase subunit beta